MPTTARRLDVTLLLTLWISCLLMDRARLRVLSCPAQCTCRPGHSSIHVHCADSNFTTMPDFTRRMFLELLDLNDNSISVIPAGAFREPHVIRELRVARNDLRELDPAAFAKMSSLRILDLSQNKLGRLYKELFRDASSLEVLKLGNNDIPVIPSGLFLMTSKLSNLDLSDNRLNAVPAKSLHALTTLSSLNLSLNTLRGLDVGDFKSLATLQELRLAGVSLGKVQRRVFTSLKDLKWLDLSNNELTQVNFVEGLTSLRYLDLTGNPLVCDCQLLEFYQWVNNHASALQASSNAICSAPGIISGRAVLDLQASELCPSANDTVPDNTPVVHRKSVEGQLIYDPMLGWYTAAVLSAMLVLFITCSTMDRLIKKLCRYWRRRKRRLALAKLRCQKSLTNEQNEVMIPLMPLNPIPAPDAPTAPVANKPVMPCENHQEFRPISAERHSIITSNSSENNNMELGRTSSVKNRPRLTLTVPESNKKLQLPSCLKKADGHLGKVTESPSKTTFFIHPNCLIHSATGPGANNIRKNGKLESSV